MRALHGQGLLPRHGLRRQVTQGKIYGLPQVRLEFLQCVRLRVDARQARHPCPTATLFRCGHYGFDPYRFPLYLPHSRPPVRHGCPTLRPRTLSAESAHSSGTVPDLRR
jgi:hypothetical protein